MKISSFSIARKDALPLIDWRQLRFSHGSCAGERGIRIHVIAIPFFVLVVGVRP